jgi:hypothetical protein
VEHRDGLPNDEGEFVTVRSTFLGQEGIDELPSLTEVTDAVSEHQREFVLIPAVDVDRSAAMGLNLVPALFEILRQLYPDSGSSGGADELLDMGIINLGYAIPVLSGEVLKRRWPPQAIECDMAIGQKDQKCATRPKHPIDIREEADGFGKVLEQVACDDEVGGFIADRPKSFRIQIGDDVRHRELSVGAELWKQRGILLGIPPVHVPDLDPIVTQRERGIARSQLEP